eukprot:344226_1
MSQSNEYIQSLQQIFEEYYKNQDSICVSMSCQFIKKYMKCSVQLANVDNEFWSITRSLLENTDKIFHGKVKDLIPLNNIINVIVSKKRDMCHSLYPDIDEYEESEHESEEDESTDETDYTEPPLFYDNELVTSEVITSEIEPICCPYRQIINDVLINFYHIQSIVFVKSSYWCNIQTIYEKWKSFNRKTRKIENIFFKAFVCERERIKSEYDYDKKKWVQVWISSVPSYAKYDRPNIERDECLTIYKPCKNSSQLFVCGYIRSIDCSLNIPDCILQIIIKYCLLFIIPLYRRIKDLIDDAVNNMYDVYNDAIGMAQFQQFERLKQIYDVIYFSNCQTFYDIYNEKINYILKQISLKWSNKYLWKIMDLTDYTKEIEQFVEKSYDNYQLDVLCDQIIIPSYVNAVSSSSYDKMVCELTKAELIRVYKLFCKVNKTEAKKLNKSYKNKNKIAK